MNTSWVVRDWDFDSDPADFEVIFVHAFWKFSSFFFLTEVSHKGYTILQAQPQKRLTTLPDSLSLLAEKKNLFFFFQTNKVFLSTQNQVFVCLTKQKRSKFNLAKTTSEKKQLQVLSCICWSLHRKKLNFLRGENFWHNIDPELSSKPLFS